MAKRGLPGLDGITGALKPLSGRKGLFMPSFRRLILEKKFQRLGGESVENLEAADLVLYENWGKILEVMARKSQAQLVNYEWLAKSSEEEILGIEPFMQNSNHSKRQKPAGNSNVKESCRQATIQSFFSKNEPSGPEEALIFPLEIERPEEGVIVLVPEINRSDFQISQTKIAGFDVDGTFIVPKSGKKHPIDSKDWKWNVDVHLVAKKMAELIQSNYRIVLFSNQKGMAKAKPTAEEFKIKMQNVLSSLIKEINAFVDEKQKDLNPFVVFVACDGGKFRKPSGGMFELLQSNYNSGIKIDLKESFFVGDAAGRSVNWKKGAPKDFSCSDRKFAINLGLRFFTPEEYFLEESEAEYSIGNFDPRALPKMELEEGLALAANLIFPPGFMSGQEVVIFVGIQGAGKSKLFEDIFKPRGYRHINSDLLKSKARCHAEMRKFLQQGENVVVDNTNGSPGNRAEYIEIAKSFGLEVRCLWLSYADLNFSEHACRVRELLGYPELPKIARYSYVKRFIAPAGSEGFSEIIEVPFIPRFQSEEERELFYKFTN